MAKLARCSLITRLIFVVNDHLSLKILTVVSLYFNYYYCVQKLMCRVYDGSVCGNLFNKLYLLHREICVILIQCSLFGWFLIETEKNVSVQVDIIKIRERQKTVSDPHNVPKLYTISFLFFYADSLWFLRDRMCSFTVWTSFSFYYCWDKGMKN